MTKKIICVIIFFNVLFMVVVMPAVSQDSKKDDSNPILPDGGSAKRYIPKYEAGQAGVTVGLGPIFPLFFQKFTGEYIEDTHLTVGASIWLEFDIFLWKGLSTGMEIGGMFALTPNLRTLFMAPITVHLKYTFQVYPIEFPISFAFGANMGSLANNFKIDFIIKPKVGITYRINQNWSAGLFMSYWWVVQPYTFTLGKAFSRMGNFLDLSAGFSYVF